MWINKKPTQYKALWTLTVLPWQLSSIWNWELINDDVDNTAQNNQN